MDGVLVDSESAWIPLQHGFSTGLFGAEIYNKIGSTIGLSIDTIYERAARHGFSLQLKEYYEVYDNQAKLIYGLARPTQGIIPLLEYLKRNDFKIGLVSSSRGIWIDLALANLNIADSFDIILSLNDNKAVAPKPAPEGYRIAMDALGADPSTTIIVEDSNAGIQSATDSGAYTIAFTEHLLPGYVQIEANANANSMDEIMRIVEAKLQAGF